MKKLLFVCVALVLALSLAVAACARPAPTPTPSPSPKPTPSPSPTVKPTPTPTLPTQIDIATHPVGAQSNLVSTGWAEIIGKYTPMKVAVKPMAGPVVYLPQVNSGQINIGIDVTAGLYRAWAGEEEWAGKRQTNLRSLFQAYVLTGPTGTPPIAVRKDSKFYEVKDLKGARVASDYGGNVNVVRYFTVAAAGAGMTWDDVTKVPVTSLNGGWVALRDGRADACFGQGLAVPDALETNASIGIRFIGYPRNPDEIPVFKTLLPGFSGIPLKPTPGGILDREIWGNTIPFWYVSSTYMNDETAYQLVKTVWEHAAEIQSIHQAVSDFSPKTMVVDPWVPFHPGAIKFYKEKGVWTDALEQKQQALLKM